MPNIKPIVDKYKKQIDKKNAVIKRLLNSYFNNELLSHLINNIVKEQISLKMSLSKQISDLTTYYRKFYTYYRQFEDYKELRKYRTVKQYINANPKVKKYRKKLKSIEKTLSTLRSLKNKVKG